MPPVIEQAAQERVERYVQLARESGRLAADRDGVPSPGWFVAPRVAADLPPTRRSCRRRSSARCSPSSACATSTTPATGWTQLPFALTGGLFARNPHTVERVVRRSPVGNLYVNRPITGAMVGRQPFGGNRLSGTGTKAGGPDYLLHFVEPKVVTENTVRHGLVI